MNSKLIAIIAVVAMCGAALVGVGYAYQATYQTGNTTISGDTAFITITPNGGAVTSWTNVAIFQYDTSNNAGTITYDPKNSPIELTQDYTLKIDFKNVSSGDYNLTLSAEAPTDSASDISFTAPTIKSVKQATTVEGLSSATADNDGTYTVTANGSVMYLLVTVYSTVTATPTVGTAPTENVQATGTLTFNLA